MIPYDFYYRAAYDNFLKDIDVKCYFIKFGPKQDFEFIVDIESLIASILRKLDRVEEAVEIERRLSSVRAILADDESAN